MTVEESERFGNMPWSSGRYGDVRTGFMTNARMCESFLCALINDLQAHPESFRVTGEGFPLAVPRSRRPSPLDPSGVFIVHGHDEAAKFEVARSSRKLAAT